MCADPGSNWTEFWSVDKVALVGQSGWDAKEDRLGDG